MIKANSSSNVAHPFWPVKSDETISIGSTVPSMIHYKVFQSKRGKRILYRSIDGEKAYGVSSSHKVLTKGLLLKKWDLIRDCLEGVCELTPAERAVTLELLRFQAYYPQVYPKASQVAEAAHVGKATFWRTVNKLRDMNLLEVINQFVLRVEAQTSNLYLLNKLLIMIAKYLAEHMGHIWPKWIEPWIKLPWPRLWAALRESRSNDDGLLRLSKFPLT